MYLLATIAVIGIIGCEGKNPLSVEEGSEIAMVGELKSDTAPAIREADIEIVKAVTNNVMAAPSIVQIEEADHNDLIVSLSHKETEGDNDEIIVIEAIDGALLPRDRIRFYTVGGYLGQVKVPHGDISLSEIHIRLENADLGGEGKKVYLKIEVARDGRVIADETMTIDRREVATGPTLETISAGDFEDEIVLIFSEDVSAYRSIKDNISVVVDNKKKRIRSYEEDRDEITLIMSKDLIGGTYEVSYNGEGGLEDLDGEDVSAFSTTLTVEVEDDETPALETVWKTIPHGLYNSGNHMLTALEHFGYKVSPWAKEILSSPRFKVERGDGETILYRVTAEELGLTGIYTMSDIILATVRAGYRLVPKETAAQLRLLYRNQPEGQLITVVSSPMARAQGTYVFALGGGSAQYPGKHLIAVNTMVALGGEYKDFVVTK